MARRLDRRGPHLLGWSPLCPSARASRPRSPGTGRAGAAPRGVVVTGGAGFIGANLVRRLLHEGHEVVVVDDLSTGRLANLDGVVDRVEVHEASVLDGARLDAALAGAGAVVHLAPPLGAPLDRRPDGDPRGQRGGTLAVLGPCAGPVPVPARPTWSWRRRPRSTAPTPPCPSARTSSPPPSARARRQKLAARATPSPTGHSYGLDVLVLRFFNVFGPLQPPATPYAAVVPAFVDAALAGRP